MQDAIDSEASDLGQRVANGRASVTEAKIASEELADAERRIEEIRKATEKEIQPVKYDAFMPTWLKVTLTVLLIFVEFIANQPIFRIIWPLSANIERSAADAIESASTQGVFAAGLSLAGI